MINSGHSTEGGDSNHPLEKRVRDEFERRFGTPAQWTVRAPGRVNLIGEHTDYNEGFVLPMAIDHWTWIALRPREDRKLNLYSLDLKESAEADLDHLQKGGSSGWGVYAEGVTWALLEKGFDLRGFEGVVASDVPIGAGLSSSASVELSIARAFASVSGFDWDATLMAKLCQKAENEWVGVNCGIMDQLISARGIGGHALLIDCRDLHCESVPLPPGTSVAVLDTAKRRSLVGSAYNERREQCTTAARAFGVEFLRDVAWDQFTEKEATLPPKPRARARHVISENERTVQAAKILREGDARAFGQLMNESHESLRDDFEVSCEELDVMVEIAREKTGCFGARMTGAGFGGCAVALVQSDQAKPFTEEVAKAYERRTQLKPQIYVCQAANGAEVLES